MPYLGVTPSTAAGADLDGKELILDADADTTITADTDDQIDVRIAGADDFQFTANTFTVLSGSTLAVASGATIANSGTATGFSASTLAAATTVGDGTAEDTKIVFDGNAQDYYIGLDDTDDDLKIGLGSAVGTTTHMSFDETGAVLKPLQPCVMVHPAGVQYNLTADSNVEVVWGTERFDVNSDFASNTFTAPVTGKYLICIDVRLDNLDTAATYVHMYVVSSNRNYNSSIRDYTKFSADLPRWGQSFTGIIDMDASDTLVVQLYFAGGASQSDVQTESYFSIGLFA